jgi:hypothetical protein
MRRVDAGGHLAQAAFAGAHVVKCRLEMLHPVSATVLHLVSAAVALAHFCCTDRRRMRQDVPRSFSHFP